MPDGDDAGRWHVPAARHTAVDMPPGHDPGGDGCTFPPATPTCPPAVFPLTQVFFGGGCQLATAGIAGPGGGCLVGISIGEVCYLLAGPGGAATCPPGAGAVLTPAGCVFAGTPPICAPGTPGEQLVAASGLCFPLGGSTGPASANGGNGGSARGGDGGRGGDGVAPQCNQSTNDTYWADDKPPSVSCGAGGSGGDAGDGGISEAGDGGLAFTDGFA